MPREREREEGEREEGEGCISDLLGRFLYVNSHFDLGKFTKTRVQSGTAIVTSYLHKPHLVGKPPLLKQFISLAQNLPTGSCYIYSLCVIVTL